MAIDTGQFHSLHHFNSGAVDIDSSGNGVTLTLNGTTNPVGKLNEALSTDGIDDTARGDNIIAQVANDTTGTIATWLDVDSLLTNTIQVVEAFGNDANAVVSYFRIFADTRIGLDRFAILLSVNGTLQWFFTSDNDLSSFSGNIAFNIVHDGVSPVLYLNNTLQPITFINDSNKTAWLKDLIADSPNPADNWMLGARRDNGVTTQYCKCIYDEHIITSQAWGTAEVSEYWNGGAGQEFSPPIHTVTVGVATAVGGNQEIDVSMPYTDDENTDSTYTVDYKLSSDVFYTNWVTGASNTPSPFLTTITGLIGAETYDVKVTYIDPDGVTGTNPQTITDIVVQALPNKVIPIVVKSEFVYTVVRNDSVGKIVRRTSVDKVVK